jgi:hypothetical protein
VDVHLEVRAGDNVIGRLRNCDARGFRISDSLDVEVSGTITDGTVRSLSHFQHQTSPIAGDVCVFSIHLSR